MNGSPSYRLGDFANSNLADGDYVVFVTGIENAQTKDGKPQIKTSSKVWAPGSPLHGKPHTWYYTLTNDALFRLFNDLITAGCDANFDPGPPGPHYVQTFQPALVNRAFLVNVATKGDFTNTKIRSAIQLGPDGMPVGATMGGPATPTQPAAQPTPQPAATVMTPFGQQPVGNTPQNSTELLGVGPAPAMTFGNAQPVSPGAPPVAAPGGFADANSLFRQG
jgi:hypothetical protein